MSLKRGVALFDLDGTLTWHDTLMPYLAGYAARHPANWLRLCRVPIDALGFLLHRDRGALKSRLIRAVMGGNRRSQIDAWSESYVNGLHAKGAFRPAALEVLDTHRAAGDHLVLLSASPDLYVPLIGRLLGFERTVCTELTWSGGLESEQRLDGRLRTPNRRGSEKTHCLNQLRAEYPGLPVVAYGNSDSDLAHLTQADRALLVNGNSRARRLARLEGIEISQWT
jgi:phosphatidylglycerophosphatase C